MLTLSIYFEDIDSVNIICENISVVPKQIKGSESLPYHHGDLRRSLIDAALALVTEEQDWTFSLREVARRAGVSHSAPYNHFANKQDLLAAVAATGFAQLGERLLAAISGIENAQDALVRSAVAYATFGVENPAHYRLMFSSALVTAQEGRPEPVAAAGAEARAILAGIIRRGAAMGIFDAVLCRDEELRLSVLTAWSAVHGFTMLTIDGIADTPEIRSPMSVEEIAKKLTTLLCYGLLRR
jgi:AcrR family transcriptional regulator